MCERAVVMSGMAGEIGGMANRVNRCVNSSGMSRSDMRAMIRRG